MSDDFCLSTELVQRPLVNDLLVEHNTTQLQNDVHILNLKHYVSWKIQISRWCWRNSNIFYKLNVLSYNTCTESMESMTSALVSIAMNSFTWKSQGLDDKVLLWFFINNFAKEFQIVTRNWRAWSSGSWQIQTSRWRPPDPGHTSQVLAQQTWCRGRCADVTMWNPAHRGLSSETLGSISCSQIVSAFDSV